MIPVVRPALDPMAHRAAIQALEAQRAAYTRYAQSIDTHRDALGSGSGDRAATAADAAARGYDALAEGARQLGPVLAGVTGAGTDDQVAEVQRQVASMMQAAHSAGTAIQNLTTQLEAWRDAYARQLTSVGLTPGAEGGDALAVGAAAGPHEPAAVGTAARPSGYGPRGRAGGSSPHAPSLIDRTG